MDYTKKSNTYQIFTKKFAKNANFCLTPETRLNYIKLNSRDKLEKLLKAKNSTPILDRAFFIRSVYAPIKNSLFSDRLFSMVERNGQPFAVGCVPLVAVCHPVTLYRPNVTMQAVVLNNLLKDTAKMIYKFLCINRTQNLFNLCFKTIQATSEEQARFALTADFRCLGTVARINPTHLKNTAKNDRTFNSHEIGGIYA